MQKLTLIIMVVYLFAGKTVAQTVRCVSASTQNWSGGIAGRNGANFEFQFEFSGSARHWVPDSVWVDGKVFGLKLPDSISGDAGNMKVRKQKHLTVYTLRASTSHDLRNPTAHTIIAPLSGVACLSYKAGGKTKYLAVKEFSKVIAPLSYP